MFKNKAFQVKMVNDNGVADGDAKVVRVVEPAEIAEIAKDFVSKTIIVAGGVIAANRVLKTICEVTIIIAKAKSK